MQKFDCEFLSVLPSINLPCSGTLLQLICDIFVDSLSFLHRRILLSFDSEFGSMRCVGKRCGNGVKTHACKKTKNKKKKEKK